MDVVESETINGGKSINESEANEGTNPNNGEA